jgi:hypothetical protein
LTQVLSNSRRSLRALETAERDTDDLKETSTQVPLAVAKLRRDRRDALHVVRTLE